MLFTAPNAAFASKNMSGDELSVGLDLPSGEPTWVVAVREVVIPIVVFVWMVKFLAMGVIRPFFATGMAAHLHNRPTTAPPEPASDAAEAPQEGAEGANK